ncbi:hypothetical protein [Deinococcus marmoris]|uniref:Uncharacterized protein n=1 Tax=Deinococcus marmoris TaxID=249408 RepID=A0A1U7NVE2_9DEIO|nr:hypothetical protein [Deinococcus marmoris]OLV16898.1 hypothetical protein BOO71_0010561 [Deinococcus marmoris]
MVQFSLRGLRQSEQVIPNARPLLALLCPLCLTACTPRDAQDSAAPVTQVGGVLHDTTSVAIRDPLWSDEYGLHMDLPNAERSPWPALKTTIQAFAGAERLASAPVQTGGVFELDLTGKIPEKLEAVSDFFLYLSVPRRNCTTSELSVSDPEVKLATVRFGVMVDTAGEQSRLALAEPTEREVSKNQLVTQISTGKLIYADRDSTIKYTQNCKTDMGTPGEGTLDHTIRLSLKKGFNPVTTVMSSNEDRRNHAEQLIGGQAKLEWESGVPGKVTPDTLPLPSKR